MIPNPGYDLLVEGKYRVKVALATLSKEKMAYEVTKHDMANVDVLAIVFEEPMFFRMNVVYSRKALTEITQDTIQDLELFPTKVFAV